jgi:hypothetical protein
LCVWLLAYAYAPLQRLAHADWYVRIVDLRVVVGVIVRNWSNIAAEFEALLVEFYTNSREQAAEETGLPLETFPDTCPWTAEEMLKAPLEGSRSPFGPNWGETHG